MEITLHLLPGKTDKKLFDYVYAVFGTETPTIKTQEPLMVGDTIFLLDNYEYVTTPEGKEIYPDLEWFPIEIVVKKRRFEIKDTEAETMELIPFLFACEIVPAKW